MKRVTSSLTFKIGFTIINATIFVQIIVGVIYISRFSTTVDARTESRLVLPGRLINSGLLSLASLTEPDTMQLLVGETLAEGFIFDRTGNVLAAYNPEHQGLTLDQIAALLPIPIDFEHPDEQFVLTSDLVAHTIPIYRPGDDSARLIVYFSASRDAAQQEKAAIRLLFLLGSVATIVTLSVIIIVSFRRMILTHIHEVVQVFEQVGNDNLNVRLAPVVAAREMRLLRDGVNAMVKNLFQRELEKSETDKQLAEYRTHLERLVEERTAELSYERDRVQQYLDIAGVIMVAVDETGQITMINKRGSTMLGYQSEADLVGANWENLCVPVNNRSDERAFRAKMIAGVSEQVFDHEGLILSNHGSEYLIRWQSTVIRSSSGEPIGVLSSGQDITETRRIELEREEAQKREHEQRVFAEALNDISLSVTSTLNIETVLDRVLQNIHRAVPHEVANIGLMTDDKFRIVRYSGPEWLAEYHTRFADQETPDARIAMRMRSTRQPVVVNDTREFEEWYMDLTDSDEITIFKYMHMMRSYMCVPIIWRDVMIGSIHLASKRSDAYDLRDMQRLQVFAGQVAIAIQNARLYHEGRELAATEERERIARDLHDAVNQTLFSAKITAEALPQIYERNPARGKQIASDLVQMTRGALAEMRSLLVELRPESLVKTDLGKLLTYLCEGFTGHTTVPVETNLVSTCLLAPQAQIVYYRVAQEALNNIAKHANASHVTLDLHCVDGSATLRIGDDGRGFDMSSRPDDHFGIRNMLERAESIDAALSIDSQPGNGTTVELLWQQPEES